MTLEELIKTLEGAQELSTEGEWQCKQHRLLQMNGLYHASADRFSDAQAIAIRHNAGAEVLRHLERARQTEREWDRRSGTLHECIAEQRTRAESAEAEVGRLKANPDLAWMPTDPTP